jgi:hypothetical protein
MDRTAHYVLTLNGTPQLLSSVLPGNGRDYPLCSISLQPRGTNGNPVYIGATSSLSTTDYGVKLEVPLSGIPPAPWEREFSHGPLRLGSFYVLGTNGEFLHIFVTQYGPNG